MADLYDELTGASLSRINRALKTKGMELAEVLAQRGTLGSSIGGKTMFDELMAPYTQQATEIIPELQLKKAEAQESQRRFDLGLGEQQRSARAGESMDLSRLGESKRQFDQTIGLQREQWDYERDMMEKQLEDMRRQQEDWWQPFLGQLGGSLLGTVLSPIAAIGGEALAGMGATGINRAFNLTGENALQTPTQQRRGILNELRLGSGVDPSFETRLKELEKLLGNRG